MKKIYFVLMLSAFSFAQAQDWKGNLSGTFGILNAKIRIQYEKPIGDQYTVGANLNYYMVNWEGPIIEPFARIYVGDSNQSGGFFQAKVGYGNLTSLPYMNSTSSRWSTFGGGAAWGYKYVRSGGFSIEPIIGLRYYSAPNENIDLNSSNGAEQLGEDIGWFITTGFPVEFQLKFGYQF